MAAACSGCGEELTSGARFCASCGRAVAAEATVSGAEERKVVSVLFCDLVGFTAHTERSDPEDVRARLTTFHAHVRQDVERFGGKVEKLMGDGVFAVFGAPTAHEDDAERAVRAALRIQESVDDLNRDQPDLELVVRAAVTTGEAIVQLDPRTDREGIVGDVVNTASRLEGVAAPGTVVVDERTHSGTRATIDYTGLPSVSLKGKADSTPVWRATGTRSRYGVGVEEESAAPFIGRREELSLLVDAFDRSVRRRTPQLVTITGEPGVGKTRLIREFRHAIDDRSDLVWWRQGRCLPYGEGVTFWAIGELVKAHAGILESEAPHEASAKLSEAIAGLVTDPEEAKWIATRLGPLIGTRGAEGAERSELFAAWLRFFEALAAKNPLVMVIEDLHWADDAVLEFLDHLTEWASDSPILLIATSRPELLTDHPEWGAGKRNAVAAALAPLTDDEAATLVAALAHRPVMRADMQQALLERAGGNPLYVTEYVHLADEEGWFDRAAQGEDLPLPDSIQALIAARIDLLSTDDKALLLTAAVVGRTFWTGALSFAEVAAMAEIREGLRRLSRRDLIRPIRRSSMQGQDEYSFAHVLIRDVAYSRLTRAERARHHASTARWLEAVSGDRVADVAELLAHHLATAFELAPSDDDADRRRIYRFLMLASERAMSFDVGKAAGYAERAADFATTDSEQGRALLARAQTRIGFLETGGDLLGETIAHFRRAGDRAGELEATVELANLEWYGGNADEADRLGELTLDLMEGLPPSGLVARAVASLASTRHLRGKEDDALELADRALDIARQVGDTRIYARALMIRASTLVQIGDTAAVTDIEEALRIQTDMGATQDALGTYNNLATFFIATGDLGRGLDCIREGIRYGNQRGLVSEVDWSQMTLCEVLFPLGEWDEILDITASHAGLERLVGGQVEGGLRFFSRRVEFFRGDVVGSWESWQDHSGIALAVKDPQVVIPTLIDGVMMAWEAGDAEATKRWAGEFVEFSSEHPVFLGIGLLPVARPLISLGMKDEVERLCSIAEGGSELAGAMLDGVRALLAGDRSDHETALRMWEPLIEYAERHHARFYGSMALTEAARAAAALSDEHRFVELAGAAREQAEAMGARLILGWLDDIEPPEVAAKEA